MIGAGLVWLIAVPLPTPVRLALLAWLALVAGRALRRGAARARWSPGSGWELCVGGGRWVPAVPTCATRALPSLVLLWLADDEGRRRCLLLTPASCGAATHRRLRARLRLEGCPPGAVVAAAGRG